MVIHPGSVASKLLDKHFSMNKPDKFFQPEKKKYIPKLNAHAMKR